MIFTALISLAIAQCGPYTRTRVDGNADSYCLYWPEGSRVEWRINDQGNPENLGDVEFTAVEAALAAWQTEMTTCGSLTLAVGPRTPSRRAEFDTANPSTHTNVVLWRLSACATTVNSADACWLSNTCGNLYDCWDHNPNALGLTITSFDPSSGKILDSDIELNTSAFLFTTVDSPICVSPNFNINCVATDIQNSLAHEFGHSLGLAHNCTAGSTMAAVTTPGELSKRSLDNGSKQAVCEIYPKGLPALRCGIGGSGGGGGAGGQAGGGGGGGKPVSSGCSCNGGPDGLLTFAMLSLVQWIVVRGGRRAGS